MRMMKMTLNFWQRQKLSQKVRVANSMQTMMMKKPTKKVSVMLNTAQWSILKRLLLMKMVIQTLQYVQYQT